MVHPRVNVIFVRVSERKGVNEIYVSNFLYPLSHAVLVFSIELDTI